MMHHEPENLAKNIDWDTVRAVLASRSVIEAAKGDSRRTERLEFEDLDSFVHGLVREAKARVADGRVIVTDG